MCLHLSLTFFFADQTGLVVREPGAPPLEENEVLLVVQFLDPMQKETKVNCSIVFSNFLSSFRFKIHVKKFSFC